MSDKGLSKRGAYEEIKTLLGLERPSEEEQKINGEGKEEALGRPSSSQNKLEVCRYIRNFSDSKEKRVRA